MRIQKNVTLAPFTTFRVGGPARFFVRAASMPEITEALAWARERGVPYFILGGGTNVLAADEGFSGLVIKIENSNLEVREDGTIMVRAGVPMGRVVQEAARRGFSGLEWAAGLPGTVGGAVFGNAGAFGHETGEFVEAATVIRLDGTVETLPRQALDFRYRWSCFKARQEDVIAQVAFRLVPGDQTAIEADMRRAMAARLEHQPLGDHSEGCIFKNPSPERPAGRLIDECGLKGMGIGGAEVSDKHANFIVNRGTATARDIAELISLIKDRVREKMGIVLEEEIRFLNSKFKVQSSK